MVVTLGSSSLSPQALKFESHLKNALVMFLLSRAQGNVNIAHYLYWSVLLLCGIIPMFSSYYEC